MMHGPMSSPVISCVQRLGAHVGFALPVELHVGLAAVGPVPQQHPVAALDQRLGQRAQARDVLAEPAARRQGDEIACLAEDFVDDVAAVDLDGLVAALSVGSQISVSGRHQNVVADDTDRDRCGCSTPA